MLPARDPVGPDRFCLSRQRFQLRSCLRQSGAQASIRASHIALREELRSTCAAFGDGEPTVVGCDGEESEGREDEHRPSRARLARGGASQPVELGRRVLGGGEHTKKSRVFVHHPPLTRTGLPLSRVVDCLF